MGKHLMGTHKNLEVWHLGISLVLDIYQITNLFPKRELYGLTAQLRRCAVSVPSNIAEGAARKSRKEYIHSLYISLGSLSELETQILISYKLGYIKNLELMKKIEVLRRKILKLVRYLKTTA
ncbi:four helix bundle protein [Candidatus Zixiibacteriota bacterium]